jgi:hypothetical protein
MKLQWKVLLVLLLAAPAQLFADAFLMPGSVAKDELVKEFPQPYIVKKGDTLWDIAQEYFADPEKWLKIWEQNLYVSNPDLIYPGNELWLEYKAPAKQAAKKPVPKRPVVKLEPRIIYKPAERMEKPIDTSVLLTALARQDFIGEGAIQGIGHIVDSEDERLNYGAGDNIYLTLDVKANPGEEFNIFRTGKPIYATVDGEQVITGYLVKHLGRVQVRSYESGIYRATIIRAFEEIGRTDRLKRVLPSDYSITPEYPTNSLLGKVIYIRQDAAEAGQGQVIGIDLGIEDDLRPGSVLGVYRAGRLVLDKTYEEQTYQALPDEKIGEVIVLVPQDKASIVLVTKSSSPINIGDFIQTLGKK